MLPAMGTPAGGSRRATAAFFDLDRTIISRSSTLAFVPSFYRHGLISRAQAVRGGLAQLVFRAVGADHDQMERIKEQARRLLDAHRAAGRDVFIVSTSGQEMVGPIGAMLGASGIIATRMRHDEGRYTGEMEFYAYGEGKAVRILELATERGYDLADCFAYSDSVTDLPMLETVGRPHAVNPDRQLRRVALARGWPVLAFAGRSGQTCEQQLQ